MISQKDIRCYKEASIMSISSHQLIGTAVLHTNGFDEMSVSMAIIGQPNNI